MWLELELVELCMKLLIVKQVSYHFHFVVLFEDENYITNFIPLGGQKVAIKVQKVIPDYENDIKEEYKILKYVSTHPNLPTFIGAFYKKNEVWFVLQVKLCAEADVSIGV